MKFGWLFFSGLVFSVVVFANPDFVKVKGYSLGYEIAGNGSEVILFEAGGSVDLSNWEPVFEKMSEHDVDILRAIDLEPELVMNKLWALTQKLKTSISSFYFERETINSKSYKVRRKVFKFSNCREL